MNAYLREGEIFSFHYQTLRCSIHMQLFLNQESNTMLKYSEIRSNIQKTNHENISFCLYVNDNQLDVKLPISIKLQYL